MSRSIKDAMESLEKAATIMYRQNKSSFIQEIRKYATREDYQSNADICEYISYHDRSCFINLLKLGTGIRGGLVALNEIRDISEKLKVSTSDVMDMLYQSKSLTQKLFLK